MKKQWSLAKAIVGRECSGRDVSFHKANERRGVKGMCEVQFVYVLNLIGVPSDLVENHRQYAI